MKPYQGELDNIDPVALGTELCQKGLPFDDHNDPTYPFYLHDSVADFLIAFHDAMEKAYYKEQRRLSKEKHLAAIPAFQVGIPTVGTSVFIEFPGNPGNYFPCSIEFVPVERTQVLIRMLDVDPNDLTKPPLRLVGYEYPGKFPRFLTKAEVDAAVAAQQAKPDL